MLTILRREGSRPGWLRRIGAVLGILVGVLLATPGTASAHAVLLATTPGGFQILNTPPAEVTLRFSETIDVSLAEIQLIGPGGAPVAGVSKPVHPPGKPDTVAANLPPNLANGTYTVTYRITSGDSHPVEGAFAFSIGEVTGGVAAGAESGQKDGTVSVLYGVARWLAYAALALVVGTAFFVAVCWPGGESATGVRGLLWAGWGTLTGATVLSYLLYGPSVAGGSLARVVDPGLLVATLDSRIGVVLLVRLVLLGVLAAAFVQLRRKVPFDEHAQPAQRRRGGLALAAGAALAVTWSLANHSATGSQVLLALPVDAIHLLAMSIWLGGLPVLLGVLMRSGEVAAMREATPRFSRIALISVLALIVTGTYQAWREIGTPDALFGTTYGVLLAVKVGMVVVLVLLGVLARRWVRRHYEFEIVSISDKRRARRGPGQGEVSRFRRVVAVEVVLGAAVLAATATLVNAEPAEAELTRIREEAAIPARTGPVNVVLPFDAGAGPSGAGRLAVLVTPGKVGRNEVHLAVLDTAGRPKKVAELKAELWLPTRGIGPIPVQTQLIGGDHAIGPNAPITMPGLWELAVTIRTSEIDQAVVRVPVGAR
jgi:copper transport protein